MTEKLGLEERLESGEGVLEVGRVIVTSRIPKKRAKAESSLVAVTDRRVLWTDVAPGGERVAELRFQHIRRAAERSQFHRWALLLRHDPIERLAHVPAYHLGFIAGGNRSEVVPFTETELRFSRRETRAAIAVRDRLLAHGIDLLGEPSALEQPRSERVGERPPVEHDRSYWRERFRR